MGTFYAWMLFLLLQQNCVMGESSCPEIQVNGVKGKDVTLEVSNREITRITWITLPDVKVIATKRPGRDLDTDFPSPLRGRLAATPNGSLIIQSVQLEDQRKYKADIVIGEDSISVCYDLRVYEELLEDDISITPNITSMDPCEMALTGSVIRKYVTSISWSSRNSSDINVTDNVLLVPPGDIYSIFICTAINPVSNASKAVQPRQYCEMEIIERATNGRDATRIAAFSSVAIIAFLVVLGVFVYLIKKSKLCKTSAAATQEDSPELKKKRMQSNDANKAETVYVTVDHAKGETPQRDRGGKSVVNANNGNNKVEKPQRNGGVKPEPSPKVDGRIPEAVTPIESCYATIKGETPQQNGGVKPDVNPQTLYSQVQGPKGKNVQRQTQHMKNEYLEDDKTIYEKVK